MRKLKNKQMLTGAGLMIAFAVWTVFIMVIDVRPAGPNGSVVGFAAFNTWFHNMTGVHMTLYTITDWLGLVPIVICLCFAGVGLSQWIKRKNIARVDVDILLLGGYYILVIAAYGFFEMVPINYRPVLTNGYLEASYPSSTTLLVLSVLPTLKYQIDRRATNPVIRKAVTVFVIIFSFFMVIGRLLSGVHWFTDIAGGVLLSAGLFYIYEGAVQMAEKAEEREEHGIL